MFPHIPQWGNDSDLVIRTLGLRKVEKILYLNKGRMSDINDLAITVWNSYGRKTGLSTTGVNFCMHLHWKRRDHI